MSEPSNTSYSRTALKHPSIARIGVQGRAIIGLPGNRQLHIVIDGDHLDIRFEDAP